MNIQELKLNRPNSHYSSRTTGHRKCKHIKKTRNTLRYSKKVAEKEEITGVGVLQLLQDGFGF